MAISIPPASHSGPLVGLPASWLTDNRHDSKTLGLLVRIASYGPGATLDTKQILDGLDLGTTAGPNALRRLCELGYLRHHRIVSGTGVFAGSGYTLADPFAVGVARNHAPVPAEAAVSRDRRNSRPLIQKTMREAPRVAAEPQDLAAKPQVRSAQAKSRSRFSKAPDAARLAAAEVIAQTTARSEYGVAKIIRDAVRDHGLTVEEVTGHLIALGKTGPVTKKTLATRLSGLRALPAPAEPAAAELSWMEDIPEFVAGHGIDARRWKAAEAVSVIQDDFPNSRAALDAVEEVLVLRGGTPERDVVLEYRRALDGIRNPSREEIRAAVQAVAAASSGPVRGREIAGALRSAREAARAEKAREEARAARPEAPAPSGPPPWFRQAREAGWDRSLIPVV